MIEELRRQAGMTQTDLAYAAHVSIDLIRAIEYGSMPYGRVDCEKAAGIARALGWKVEDILYGSKIARPERHG